LNLGEWESTVFSLQVATRDADEEASLAAAGEASLIEVGACSIGPARSTTINGSRSGRVFTTA
jgi:hypothetical protein